MIDDDNKELNQIFIDLNRIWRLYPPSSPEPEDDSHLIELLPGITKGMVKNFLNGDGHFYDPNLHLGERPEDDSVISENLHNLSNHLKQLSFSSAMEKLGVEDREKMIELTEKAYYNSDAFAMRAARSLGYQSPDEMSVEDKIIYDRIIQIGKDASTHLYVVSNDSVDPVFVAIGGNKEQYSDKEEIEDAQLAYEELTEGRKTPEWENIHQKDGIAFYNPHSKLNIGVEQEAHEMGHYLYNSVNGLKPGRGGSVDAYGGENEEYGRKSSPLNHINDEKIKISPVYLNGIGFTPDMLKELTHKEFSTLKEAIKEHDNAGIERGADVHGVRMMMYEKGIFNMFDGTDIDKEHIRKFKEEVPESRIFNYWNTSQAQDNINNIASNEVREENTSDKRTIDVSGVVWSASNAKLTMHENGRMVLQADQQGKKIEYTLTAQETKDIQTKMDNREVLGNTLSGIILSQSIADQYQETISRNMDNQLAMRI